MVDQARRLDITVISAISRLMKMARVSTVLALTTRFSSMDPTPSSVVQWFATLMRMISVWVDTSYLSLLVTPVPVSPAASSVSPAPSNSD